MRLCYVSLLPLMFFALTVAASPRLAVAQIELSPDDGNVGIGRPPTSNGTVKLTVRKNSSHQSVKGIEGYASGYYAYGIKGYSSSTYSFGVWGNANGDISAYGIYGTTSPSAHRSYAGYFAGDVHYTGTLSGPGSDRKFKQNIRGLGSDLAGELAEQVQANVEGAAPSSGGNAGASTRSTARTKLLQLQPAQYRYRQEEYSGMGFPEGEQFGLIAQEVEEVFPELVTEEVHPGTEEVDENGEVAEAGEPVRYKSIKYVQLVPIMIQTIQEQQAEIDALRERVEALE